MCCVRIRERNYTGHVTAWGCCPQACSWGWGGVESGGVPRRGRVTVGWIKKWSQWGGVGWVQFGAESRMGVGAGPVGTGGSGTQNPKQGYF